MSTEQRGRGQEQSCQGLSPTLSTRTSPPSRSLERTAKGKESSKEWQWMKVQKIGNPGDSNTREQEK